MSRFIMKRVDQSIEEFGLSTVEGSEPATPPEPFLEELPEAHVEQLEVVLELYQTGGFPDLWDFNPEFGANISGFPNIDEGIWALGNDGDGNYFVLYPDGSVDSWCHEEGGFMERHDFASLESMIECLLFTTAVKMNTVDWGDIQERFEEMSGRSGGWEYFMEDCEEFVEGEL